MLGDTPFISKRPSLPNNLTQLKTASIPIIFTLRRNFKKLHRMIYIYRYVMQRSNITHRLSLSFLFLLSFQLPLETFAFHPKDYLHL